MATQADIDDIRHRIDEVWDNPPARNGRWGNILRSLNVQNIRGLSTTIEFTWPVTAIGGANGCGKTTILQLCSAAYTRLQVPDAPGGRAYTLGGWIRGALLGETPPVTPPAKIQYAFWDTTPTFEVDYQPLRTRWNYPRRNNPVRHVDFIGISTFAPRIERKDRLHANKKRLEIRSSIDSNPEVLQSVSRILGVTYEGLQVHTVGVPNKTWSDTIPQIVRSGCAYTEPHMGAGEQKIVRLVQYLEDLPPKSLVLLEEPELTLHPDAQMGLAWYLMSLARRKGHQIVLATHSSAVFEALPEAGRVLLVRQPTGVEVLHRVHHLRAAREIDMSVRSNKDLILVEDTSAVSFVTGLLRRFNLNVLRAAKIIPVGSHEDVSRIVGSMRSAGVRVVGIRDGDRGENTAAGLLSLPGDAAPETVLLSAPNRSVAEAFIADLGSSFSRAEAQGIGLVGTAWSKKVMKALAQELEMDVELLVDRLTLAWLQANDAAGRELASQIEAGLRSVGG